MVGLCDDSKDFLSSFSRRHINSLSHYVINCKSSITAAHQSVIIFSTALQTSRLMINIIGGLGNKFYKYS